jgi:hypothetical protein
VVAAAWCEAGLLLCAGDADENEAPMDVDDRVARSRDAETSGREPDRGMGGARVHANGQLVGSQAGSGQGLPMLASACPGWVCYAEKTHGDYILPYISSTKSPQVSMKLPAMCN